MEVTVTIPEDIAAQLHTKWADLPRAALESLALEAYRAGTLTDSQLRRLLGLSRYELDGFLKKAGIYLDYDSKDLKQDLENIRKVRGE